MEVSAALRRVKRQFGDEYNVVINDQDIYDWMYDAELDIIRSTSDNDLTLSVPATRFPIQIPDKVNIKRLSVAGKALMNISLSQLDLTGGNNTMQGMASYWYYQGGMAYLWPSPEATDKTTIDVTYARTPTQMTVVAPYLQFLVSPPTLQAGSVLTDDDWKLSKSLNATFNIAFDLLDRDFWIMNCGGDPTSIPNNHFSIKYKAGTLPSIVLSISNGTSAFSVHTLAFLAKFNTGDPIKFRLAFDNLTDTATLYKINVISGEETLQQTSTHNVAFNKQVTAVAPLYIGNIDATTPTLEPPVMRVYSIEMKSGFSSESIAFSFNGELDLGLQFAPLPTIKTTVSGHTLTTIGDIIVPAYNTFTVAESFHEDVVKFCLARAHGKNQNFRAAESEMEQYDRRVSTRRNEAQAPDTALYKIPDPSDYEDYVY